jgi:nucleotide-binding universal stress UspA family protein
MGCIVCATRGGVGGRAVQSRAISYAREQDKPLVFLYVIDAEALASKDNALVAAVRQELGWLGETLLRVAQKRAKSFQVESEIAVREGPVRDEISSFLQERSAELLFLGAPRGTTSGVFGDDAIEKFAQSIQEKSGVSVEIVRPEQPISPTDERVSQNI